MRHAIRFGAALALGVAIYRIADFDDHGYWVPLTILFVLKPDPRPDRASGSRCAPPAR